MMGCKERHRSDLTRVVCNFNNYLLTHSMMKWDGQRKKNPVSAIVQSWRLSLFGHIAWMSDEADARKILTASPLDDWRRPPGHPHGSRLNSKTWNQRSSPWTKHPIWLGTNCSAEMSSMFSAMHS